MNAANGSAERDSEQPEYLTTDEVARLLRTSPGTLRYWRHIGKGPAGFKSGRRVLYTPADIATYEAEQRAMTNRAG